VLVVNGLGFEAWLPRLLASSNFKGLQVMASQGIEPLRLGRGEHAAAQANGNQAHHAHGRGGKPGEAGSRHAGDIDPHAWQSLTNGMIYARNIASGLAKADPDNAADYLARANRYID